MEDFLQSQIQESCRLALPNGLKELMYDISREVLRAQPADVYKFITEYLSTLLVTRENLYIASKVCDVVYDCQCQPELEDELRYIGLDEQNASAAAKIVAKFFGTGEINEGNLLLKLVKKTSVDESQLPAVLTAIRQAFLRHQTNHTKIFESSSNSDEDEAEKAVRRTLELYQKTEPTFETYNCMARRIQASYRAYKVRRESGAMKSIKSYQLSKTPSKSESVMSTDEVKSDHLMLSRTENERSKVTFGALDHAKESIASGQINYSDDADLNYKCETGQSKSSFSAIQVSSTSLAGSYLSLPRYRPYSAHDIEILEESPEKERSNFDYTRENSPVEEIFINETERVDRKIAFLESSHEDNSIDETEEFYEEEEEEEHIPEDIQESADADVHMEDVTTEISENKDFDAKDNADNNTSEDTECYIVDEDIQGEHTVDN